MTTMTDLDQDLVERTAKAIGLARMNSDYAADPVTISADGFEDYWQKAAAPGYRAVCRQQAVAALRASVLLARLEELERGIREAIGEAAKWSGTPEGNRQARVAAVGRLLEVPGI